MADCEWTVEKRRACNAWLGLEAALQQRHRCRLLMSGRIVLYKIGSKHCQALPDQNFLFTSPSSLN